MFPQLWLLKRDIYFHNHLFTCFWLYHLFSYNMPSHDFVKNLTRWRGILIHIVVAEYPPWWCSDLSPEQGAPLHLWSFAIPQLLFYNSYPCCRGFHSMKYLPAKTAFSYKVCLIFSLLRAGLLLGILFCPPLTSIPSTEVFLLGNISP